MFSLPQFFKQKDDRLFRAAVALSIFLHALLWVGFHAKEAGQTAEPKMEIDLTKSFRIGANPNLKPGGGTTLVPPKIEGPPLKTENQTVKTNEPVKEWVLPGPNTQVLEKPQAPAGPIHDAPGGTPEGTGDGYLGTGGGMGGGHGQGGGIPLSKLPALLNRSEILRLLKKNYPSNARENGIQGSVVVTLHLDEKGMVSRCVVENSTNPEFNAVAEMVAKRMKFSPAMVKDSAVAAKIRQTVVFQLEDE